MQADKQIKYETRQIRAFSWRRCVLGVWPQTLIFTLNALWQKITILIKKLFKIYSIKKYHPLHHSFLINCEINPIYTIKITAAFEDMILIGYFVISIHISMEIESVALILYMIIFRIIYGTYVLDRLCCY